MAVEDERAAVAFSVTLSSQLISASMTTLAVEGAYVWYALGARETLSGFEVLAAAAAVGIATSIFAAGKGITAARNAGFAASWSTNAGKAQFNFQGIALLIALLLLSAMFLRSGPTKQSELEKKVQKMIGEISALHVDIGKQSMLQVETRKNLEGQIQTLKAEIDTLRAQRRTGNKRKP